MQLTETNNKFQFFYTYVLTLMSTLMLSKMLHKNLLKKIDPPNIGVDNCYVISRLIAIWTLLMRSQSAGKRQNLAFQ